MANLLTRRACSVFGRHITGLTPRPVLPTRSIHMSPIVHKKKSKAVSENDDLFSDDMFVEEDLIKDNTIEASSETHTQVQTSSPSLQTTSKKAKKARLTPTERKARFESHIQYLEPRLGPNPPVENPRIRKRVLITLLELANSEEDVKRVIDFIPKFRAANIEPTPDFGEILARRCEELKTPLLPLEVFGNFAKYNLRLTLPAARILIHSLSTPQHFHQLALALALFDVYDLPPINKDLVSASMVAAAFTQPRIRSSAMKDLAERLRGDIEEMLKVKARQQQEKNAGEPLDVMAKRMNNWIWVSLDRANRNKRNGFYVDPELLPPSPYARATS